MPSWVNKTRDRSQIVVYCLYLQSSSIFSTPMRVASSRIIRRTCHAKTTFSTVSIKIVKMSIISWVVTLYTLETFSSSEMSEMARPRTRFIMTSDIFTRKNRKKAYTEKRALHRTAICTANEGRWESNINVGFPFMYSQKWNCYFQNRILMFCLPVPTFLYLWEIYIFPG